MYCISLKDVIKQMKKVQSFDLEFVKYNRSTKEGGEKVVLKEASSAGKVHNKTQTINVKTKGGDYMKVHTLLITKFNNQILV